MQAIRVYKLGDPEVMRLEQVKTPVPSSGQVLVRMKAIGVNPHDAAVRAGDFPGYQPPFTPGQDGAGVIEALGRGVTTHRRGQNVYVSGSVTGTYAELAVCELRQIYPLFERLNFDQGAAIGTPYACAHRALFGRARSQSGETVLIRGATGGVGLAAVQLARAAGLNVLATGGSEAGQSLLKSQGVEMVLDHYDRQLPHKVKELTGGRGPDVILEMMANRNLKSDLELAAPGARVVIVGSRGHVAIDPAEAMNKELTILGVGLLEAAVEEIRDIHTALKPSFTKGQLTPVVRQVVPLSQASDAHRLMLQAGAAGKIVLRP